MFLDRVKNAIERRNIISKDCMISSNAIISGSEITGEVSIGQGCKVYKSVVVGNVDVGDNTSLWGPGLHVLSHIHPISFGKFCSVARNVSIQEANHSIKTPSTYNLLRNIFGSEVSSDLESKGPIRIGNDVWLGANVSVLSGSVIGDGVVVGANAVVNGHVPPYSVVVGNPSKIVKLRFEKEVIASLLQIQWWDWDLEKIRRNRAFFENDVSIETIQNII